MSRVALAFIFAAAVPASFADASPLRFRRRLGELQDGADVMGGIVEGDQELQDGTVLVEGVEEDHHKYFCKDSDDGKTKTCKTDYEKIDAEGLSLSEAKNVCAIIGQGWTVCTLGQLCPSNSDGAAMGPTLPAQELIEKYGTFPFFGDVYAPFLSADGGCSMGGSVQMGTGDGGPALCETGGGPCGPSTSNGVICCGCEKTRGQTDPYTKPAETPDHMYDCGPAPAPT